MTIHSETYRKKWRGKIKKEQKEKQKKKNKRRKERNCNGKKIAGNNEGGNKGVKFTEGQICE